MRGKILIVGLLALLLSGGNFVGAQVSSVQDENRSYSYDAIKFKLQVNKDTTVDVTEHQTYRFNGEYHQGWRNIPLKGVSAITDVRVIDAATNQPLIYSPSRLDKYNPNNWGKFTTFRQNGEQVIEWYYNQADTTHEWILKYQLHGALGFHSNRDELYWNLFTSYDVTIANLEAKVELVDNQFSTGDLRWHVYGGPVTTMNYSIIDNRSFLLSATVIPAGAEFTVAASWPPGLVDRGAFWRDWLWVNLPYILAVLLILFALVYSLVRWYVLEYRPLYIKSIVPEYAPPRGLSPALAQVIVKETINQRAWPAVLVDLAIKGQLTIEEIPKSSRWNENDYRLRRKSNQSGVALLEHERMLLDAVFQFGNEIKLKELASSKNRAHFAASLPLIIKQVFQDVESLGDYYVHAFTKTEKNHLWWFVGSVVWLLVSIALFLFGWVKGGGLAVLVSLGIGSFILINRNYDARLNEAGLNLKHEILGFILYLKTAERYRLQNLTPELFEKYLPYAIIFGVENKWVKAFEGLNMSAPEWYHSHAAVAGVGGLSSSGSVGGFSVSVFSASFSSSFSSAFSSSTGGGGASSGGGHTGGGGGGGGGGAS
jgi:hypothetical protein